MMRAILVLILLVAIPAVSSADERYALIVSGVSGSPKFADSQKAWTDSLESTLRKGFGFGEGRVTVLSENGTHWLSDR